MSFEIPADLTALSREELSAAIENARTEGRELAALGQENLSSEQSERIIALADFMGTANEEFSAREAQHEAFTAAFGTFAAEDEGEEVIETPEAPEAPANVEAAAQVGDPEEDDEEDDNPPAPPAPKRNAAAAARVLKRHKRPEDVPPAARRSSLVATAGIPGYSGSMEFGSLTEAGPALVSAMRSLPSTGEGIRARVPALKFSAKREGLVQGEGEFTSLNDTELLMNAANESRLEGGSLVAAGGWGAPSEISLDFCKQENVDGLISLPTVTITRGGVQYTKGPDLATVLASATGFWDQTEAVAEAGTELKTSLRPTEPAFVEKRLDAVGVMLEAGLLLRSAWPELIARYEELALTAHQIKMHNKTLNQLLALVGATTALTNGHGTSTDILHFTEMVITGERQRSHLGVNATMEVLLPAWVKAVFRADLADRNGVDFLAITDQQIDAWFKLRGANVQWLSHWQDITLTGGIAKSYPTTVEAVIYPAGSYVKGESDVITLDTVYDSTNLKKNDYVHLFIEQGAVVTNPCGEGRRVTLPLASGSRTGIANIANNVGVAPA